MYKKGTPEKKRDTKAILALQATENYFGYEFFEGLSKKKTAELIFYLDLNKGEYWAEFSENKVFKNWELDRRKRSKND